jgi:hypothetical protein
MNSPPLAAPSSALPLQWPSLDGLRSMAYTGRVDRDGGRLEAIGFCFYPFSGNPPSRGEQSPMAFCIPERVEESLSASLSFQAFFFLSLLLSPLDGWTSHSVGGLGGL